MSSVYEISDDDDSFGASENVDKKDLSSAETTMLLSEESAEITGLTEENYSSDDDDLPDVDLGKKRSEVVKKLFPSDGNSKNSKQKTLSSIYKVTPKQKYKTKDGPSTSVTSPVKPKEPGFTKPIGGVTVNLPVQPYGCQVALMSKVITAIKTEQNCLLESPTGTGKTLALLCSALAWQQCERSRKGEQQAQEYFSHYPELTTVDGATQVIGSPTAEPFDNFTRTVFGEKSIYDKPNDVNATVCGDMKQKQHFEKGDENAYGDDVCTGGKRLEPLRELNESPGSLVNIHPKRQKLNPDEKGEGSRTHKFTPPTTPSKNVDQPAPKTPEQIRDLYRLVSDLRLRTSTLIDCSIPTIYYGARTHKQLQQVIKEFKRTWYCGEAKMSVLSSREYSCIREYDRAQWSSKNDMCRGCIKTHSSERNGESNCKYYDNRSALNHKSLPPAFDLEDLIAAGHENGACPYYGARAMATSAHIVFCPYNYLIEPSIRSSMQIDLRDNIVIIDEAHNIEDICRDAASLTFTKDQVLNALKELEQVSGYRYQNSENVDYVDKLIKTLRNWDYCIPTIYYGARTHKQLQQVIKEFKRTWYCGEAKMSVLSSREYSCIREYDRAQWSSKNDMCRGCIKTHSSERNGESNCKYYDNRSALNHKSLPPAFDLEDLIAAGHENGACPYYGARAMATSAHIVFCPYNYLIEPSIRSSMQIDLRDNIVIIDEAHNIEDICRDAASLTFTKDQVLNALKELEQVSGYRYQNSENVDYVDKLIKTLRNWDYWFVNQSQLLAGKAVNYNEVAHTWQPEHFVQTLDNHNIGPKSYGEFKQYAELFCQRLREDPRTLFGVTQPTGTLIESIETVLGYLFRCEGKYKDDFTPALVKTITMESTYDAGLWRRSNFGQRVEKESLELRLMCMNPAVVFESLKVARCIILASGTLTPLDSLYSELATDFPLKVSPNHVIPRERVWVGTLTTGSNGQPLTCKSNDTSQVGVQDALGETVRWVCRVTPHGVLCFMPSYRLMEQLVKRWRENGTWDELLQLKHVFMESRNVKDHNEIMDDYYNCVETAKGAILFAVFRGKVSEGMDFKDQQARAVVTIGIPYPNTFDMAVQSKCEYNDKYAKTRNLLPKSKWLLVQAYRALNQAVGRCVRHRADWGAVLLVDARFQQPYYTQHLSGWVKNLLGNNHFTFNGLQNSPNGLENFMQSMTLAETEDIG